MKKLMRGYKDFYSKYFGKPSVYDQLATSQAPTKFIISCADSRVDPAIITQSEPGSLFVTRHVAGVVPAYKKEASDALAALEFALNKLPISDLIVLGHENCAGVRAFATKTVRDVVSQYPAYWGEYVDELGAKIGADYGPETSHEFEKESIRITISNLMTDPLVRERVNSGELTVHGWYFKVSDGKLLVCTEQDMQFREVA